MTFLSQQPTVKSLANPSDRQASFENYDTSQKCSYPGSQSSACPCALPSLPLFYLQRFLFVKGCKEQMFLALLSRDLVYLLDTDVWLIQQDFPHQIGCGPIS